MLNAVHESMRQFVPNAPRVDLIGRQLVARAFLSLDEPPPPDSTEYALALAGDVLSNALYYSLVGVGNYRSAPLRGLVLGAVGGLGSCESSRLS